MSRCGWGGDVVVGMASREDLGWDQGSATILK